MSNNGGLTGATYPQPPHRRLPADHVRESTGLGHATTIHAAQGVSADTMHGLAHRAGVPAAAVHHADPRAGRQPPLPSSRRRRRPHTIIRPETVAPRTPTEILQQILGRDDTPASATTLLRELSTGRPAV